MTNQNHDYVVPLSAVNMHDVAMVGGKNASLGEMIGALASKGVRVPGGFATTACAFQNFLADNQLNAKIATALAAIDLDNITQLTKTGSEVRSWIIAAPFPKDFEQTIRDAYQNLAKQYGDDVSFAVRSSATAEDLPEASFAGQQETYLNVKGIDNILEKIKHVFASLYNDRAIAYRVHQGFKHEDVFLSAGVQQMIRSDIGTSGVMFTLDTESGFDEVVFITSAYGLGETVVQGAVNPDEFYVYKQNLPLKRPAILSRKMGSKAIKMIYDEKNNVNIEQVSAAEQQQFSLKDEHIEELADYALTIEQHYQRPMDIEWALDGNDHKLYIVQARPETVKSNDNSKQIKRYHLKDKGKVLIEGRAIGQKISTGKVKIIASAAQMHEVNKGDVLVTDMTDPDWEPVMKRASAIITNRGGRTCHAAIIARELGVPAIVGTGAVTKILTNDQAVTISCAEGDTGYVYEHELVFEITQTELTKMPDIPLEIMMNIANPSRAFDLSNIPNGGIGLARLEFIINNTIGIHPKALLEFDKQTDEVQREIKQRIAGYESPTEFYVQKLIEGIATLAAAFANKPVIIRTSDFKSNEYANLYAGEHYEPLEENPMLGFRGASRYISADFYECFALECRAICYVRDTMGLTNVQVMIPFVRTLIEAEKVIAILKDNGLERTKNDLKIIMMCELPVNALLAEEFLEYFDGFSIGSNDMTQLTLGMDRDSGLVAEGFDERNPAVKKMLSMAITACQKHNKYIGICGQGPSDYPDFANWLLEKNISSISLNPDTVIETWQYLGALSKLDDKFDKTCEQNS